MERSAYNDVVALLLRAQEFSKSFCGGSTLHFKSTGEFRDALRESITLLKSGDTSQLKRIYQWFMPASSWQDIIGPDGFTLGNEIAEKIGELIHKNLINRLSGR